MVLSASEPDKAATNNVASSVPSSAPARPPSDPGPPAPAAPPVDVNAVQSTLFALLSQAASAANTAPVAAVHAQTAPNTFSAPPPQVPAPVPALDANQLALLQQLAQRAALGNAVPSQQPIPVPASVVPSLTTPNAVLVVPPVQGPPQPQPFPYRDDHYGAPASAPRTESEHDRFDGPDRGYPRDNFNDPRRGFRGGPRDRGRGGRGRGRWDDRDHHRERSREFPRDPRARRSRSRSPPGRYGGPGPRDARPPHSSPPGGGGRRGRYAPPAQPPSHGYGPSARKEPEAGKDEFGRDLRPESPREEERASAEGYQRRSASPLPPGTGSVTTSDRGSVTSDNAHPAPGAAAASHPQYQQSNPYPYPDALPHETGGAPTPPPLSPAISAPPQSPFQNRAPGGAGLEAFDRTTFDPSNPASWESLGKAWSATHGSMPTEQQLVQFMFAGVTLPPQSAPDTHGGAAPPPQQQHSSPHQMQEYSQQSPPQQFSPQTSQGYGDGGRDGQWPEQDRGWNSRSQGPRGGWRGGAAGGGGGGGGRAGFGSPGRARGRGRGDFGRGGYGRGDSGWRGTGREDRGRASYGYGNGRGAGNAGGEGFHGQETDAVMLSGGDDDHAWQGQQGHGGQPYGGPQQAYQSPPQPSFQPPQTYSAPDEAPQESESAEGGGGSSGRMQKVGDKWVFVRGTA
ncbi:hypothetical protein C2E23DRAFT_605508 [Lenzites betulinus]|nr:hypothetical protein C2E23DRAFT_605508 [Lenzites betulinus]